MDSPPRSAHTAEILINGAVSASRLISEGDRFDIRLTIEPSTLAGFPPEAAIDYTAIIQARDMQGGGGGFTRQTAGRLEPVGSAGPATLLLQGLSLFPGTYFLVTTLRLVGHGPGNTRHEALLERGLEGGLLHVY
jgi:hypothetical protein